MGKIIYRGLRSLTQAQPIPADFSSLNVRKTFLDFFCQDYGHTFVRSSPVMPFCDPTLAFVNAGMNQFKNVFLGIDKPPAVRAANSQKCIRIGGKHNDLSQVGADDTHHTFFEMLGNWSFGDYFKREACAMSWELLTKVYKLEPSRLYVSYFAGDERLNLESDLETREIWREIGVDESHILPFGVKDNFWEMGLTGPCGPCTEIHYDHVPNRVNAGTLVNADGSNVTELWNLVFMQYNRKSDGSLEKLKRHHVDTGMGFERLVTVLQNKTSNYDTDLFQPLIKAIEKISKHSGYRGTKTDAADFAYRVLADHTRMATIALADGFLPEKDWKVRGILRRTFDISENVFKTPKGLVAELTNHVAEILSPAYPEIGKNLQKIQFIIKFEEEYYQESRNKAIKEWIKLVKENEKLKNFDILQDPGMIKGYSYIKTHLLINGLKKIEDEIAYTLVNGCGCHPDSVERIASILGLEFDRSSFEEHVASVKQREKEEINARAHKNMKSYSSIISEIFKNGVQPTIDYFKYEYSTDDSGNFKFKPQPATIEAIILDEKLVNSVTPSEIGDVEIGLVLDRTPLFTEAGGQEADRGRITIEDGVVFQITSVTNVNDCIIHFGKFENNSIATPIAVNNIGIVEIDSERRSRIMRNHTATHLLNSALRNVLTVTSQVDSKISPEKLRFDFTVYRENFGPKELEKLENIVRNVIRHGVPVNSRTVRRNQLEQMDSITLIPGESFSSPEVSVIDINSGYFLSREPCCGTHVINTSEIIDFVIVNLKSSSLIKAGVQRIEAVTGEYAIKARKNFKIYSDRLNSMKQGNLSADEAKKCYKDVHDLEREIRSIDLLPVSKRKEFKDKIYEMKKFYKSVVRIAERAAISNNFQGIIKTSKENFIVHVLPETSSDHKVEIQKIASLCKDKPVMVFLKEEDNVTLCAMVTKDFIRENFSSEKWGEQIGELLTGNKSTGSSKLPEFFIVKHIKWDERKVKEAVIAAQEFARKYFS